MITIKDIQTVTGWTYPTALKFVERHGEKVDGKWQMKPEELGVYVKSKYDDAYLMLARFRELENET